MDDVRLELICPGCSGRFLVHAKQQGKVVECPSCTGWVDVPEIGRLPNGFERDFDGESTRQWEESARQLREGAKQQEQARHALDRGDRRDVRYEEQIERMDSLIARWENLTERAAQLLDRLERGASA